MFALEIPRRRAASGIIQMEFLESEFFDDQTDDQEDGIGRKRGCRVENTLRKTPEFTTILNAVDAGEAPSSN